MAACSCERSAWTRLVFDRLVLTRRTLKYNIVLNTKRIVRFTVWSDAASRRRVRVEHAIAAVFFRPSRNVARTITRDGIRRRKRRTLFVCYGQNADGGVRLRRYNTRHGRRAIVERRRGKIVLANRYPWGYLQAPYDSSDGVKDFVLVRYGVPFANRHRSWTSRPHDGRLPSCMTRYTIRTVDWISDRVGRQKKKKKFKE